MEKTPIKFAEGFNIYSPNEKTVTFLFGSASIHVEKFIKFLQENKDEKGYVKIKFPKSKTSGEPYAVLDTYKPVKKEDTQPNITSKGYNNEQIDITQILF